jgi:NodT family efflux transporter outer membrane factor (OMF) lipoprotein
LLVVTAGLWGCVSPKGIESLPLDSAPSFSRSGAEPLPERWWTAFGDPTLNAQVDRALDENFTVAAAWERLRAARAVVDREASDLFPDLDGVAGGELNADSDEEDVDATLRLGLEAAYEVDLWDRIESRVEAERFRASATRADYQAAELSLTAEVARTWYQLVEARAQLALVEDQIATNEAVIELLESRFAAGQIRSADVLRQQRLTEATREQAIAIRSRKAVLQHQLAVLQGRSPQGGDMPPQGALPALPPAPATGLPSDLVQRRPDVQRALRLLRAADRDLASAVSNQYPRLLLTASFTTAAENPSNLFQEWLASLLGQFVAPLFDAGERRAEVRRTTAVVRQRAAEYGQTVLTAFREVEDALARERYQIERIANLEEQLTLAEQTYQQLRTQYLNGVTDYIAVLTALTEEQRLQRDLLRARLTLLEFRIALYRALAGAFETGREREEATGSEEDDADE